MRSKSLVKQALLFIITNNHNYLSYLHTFLINIIISKILNKYYFNDKDKMSLEKEMAQTKLVFIIFLYIVGKFLTTLGKST